MFLPRVGTRWTFRLLAGVAGFCAVGYTAFQIFFVKPRRSKEKLYTPRETTVKPVLRYVETMYNMRITSRNYNCDKVHIICQHDIVSDIVALM